VAAERSCSAIRPARVSRSCTVSWIRLSMGHWSRGVWGNKGEERGGTGRHLVSQTDGQSVPVSEAYVHANDAPVHQIGTITRDQDFEHPIRWI
jgi:hypothetical protein